MNNTQKNKTEMKFYALIGSTSSYLQTLINQKHLTVNEFNVYESHINNFFSKIIIPKLKDNSFKVQVHISEYYQLLYPFKNAVFFITQEDLYTYQLNSLNKPINPIKLLELCLLMQFNNLYFVLESEDQKAQLQQIIVQLNIEINTLTQNQNLNNKIKYHYLLQTEFQIKNLKNLEFPQSLTQNYMETNFIVTNVINQKLSEIIIVNGVLFKGQKINIANKLYVIDKIQLFNESIDQALQGMIVQIQTKEDLKSEIGLIGSYRNIQFFQLDIELFVLFNKGKQILDVQYQLKKLAQVLVEPNQRKIITQVTFKNSKLQILSHTNWNQLISFSHIHSKITGVGKILHKIVQQKDSTILIPTLKFIDKFTEESEKKDHFLNRCRLCKESKINSILIPCGHMRYCFDCSVNLKECNFCDTPIQTRQSCSIKACDPQIYKQLFQWQLDINMIEHKKFKSIPDKFKFEIDCQQENIDFNFKCYICKQEMISHLIIEEGKSNIFSCSQCASNVNKKTQNAYKINVF